MSRALSQPEIALCAQAACLLEVAAPKPGNVSRYHDFGDTTFEDFLLSAVATGAALSAAGEAGVGETVVRAVQETRRWVAVNTNLGIILLLAPLAPIAKNDTRAIGRTNDCVLYGGVVHLTVRTEDEALQALAPRIPSSASPDHGTPFYDIFQRYGGDFYKVDPHLFSPAQVSLTNVKSGRTFEAGAVNAAVLRQSLLS